MISGSHGSVEFAAAGRRRNRAPSATVVGRIRQFFAVGRSLVVVNFVVFDDCWQRNHLEIRSFSRSSRRCPAARKRFRVYPKSCRQVVQSLHQDLNSYEATKATMRLAALLAGGCVIFTNGCGARLPDGVPGSEADDGSDCHVDAAPLNAMLRRRGY